ncbi:MAG: uncharacterized protein A8A55_2587 [Amphiamblys sp. WSBS2006]|nr:MAG: uncharacterized protein A8A55_2587 [Amphiamblys sp. WSBS2006]
MEILPRLKACSGSEVEFLLLNAGRVEHIAEVLAQGQLFSVGGVKSIKAYGYAVCVLPRMEIHRDTGIEYLKMETEKEEGTAGLLRKEKAFYLGRVRELLLSEGAVNVLPKMKLCPDNEMDWLVLRADRKEHVATVSEHPGQVFVGRVKNIMLYEHAVCVLPRLEIHRDSEVSLLDLRAGRGEHIAGMLGEENTVCLGRISRIVLHGYAVDVLSRMKTSEGVFYMAPASPQYTAEGLAAANEKRRRLSGPGEDKKLFWLELEADREENVARILGKSGAVSAGRFESISLNGYAVGVLPRLGIQDDCSMGTVNLVAARREHVAGILGEEKTVCVGRIQRLDIREYAVGILPKIAIHEDCEMESFHLEANREEHVGEILAGEQMVSLWRIKELVLHRYAVSILPRLEIRKDSIIVRFVLYADTDRHTSVMLALDDCAVDIGRIRHGGLWIPEEVKKKLKYTLVDREGNEEMFLE